MDINGDGGMTHSLGRKWTLWFDNPSNRQKRDNFGETLRPIYTFETVENFWCVHHNVAAPGALKPNCDVHLFKEGVTPKWEDPSCENGGRWTIPIAKGDELEKMTNDAWLDAMLACIGEMFEEMDDVCGVACNIRGKGNRVCLWTSSSENQEVQISLGQQFKEFLEVASPGKISYLAHRDAMQFSQTNRATDLYVV